MKKETLLKQILTRELAAAKKANPRYSMRAHAKKLKISPATLSRLLTGKSNLSRKMTGQMIEKLNITAEEKAVLQKQEHDPYGTVPVSQKDYAALVDKWYLSPIVCLAETKAFRPDPQWIAKRLGISEAQAHEGLSLLKRIGFLQPDEDGRLCPVDIAITTAGRSKVQGPEKNLLDKLNLVKANLIDSSPQLHEISDISSIVLATGLKKIPQAKTRIRRFRRSLAKFLDSGEKQEAYLLFIQLIPLSK